MVNVKMIADEYYSDITEFIQHIVKYYGRVHVDDLIKLVKIHKKQDITIEKIASIKDIVIEENFAYLRSSK